MPNQLARDTSLNDLLRRFWARKVGLALGLVIGAVVGLLVSLLSGPRYKAEVLLVPVKQGRGTLSGLAGQLGGLASLAGIELGGLGDEDKVALAMLSSNLLARRIVEEKQLLPVLFPEKWNADTRQWTVSPGVKIPTTWEGARYFSKKILRVSEDRRTGLVSVEVIWSDPRLAADWANFIVQRADSILRSRKIDTAEGNIKYLREQLELTSTVEVRQSISQLIADQMKEMMLAQGGVEYAYRVLDPATVPERTVGPSLIVLVVAGAFVGLLLVCAATIATVRSRAAESN